MIIVKMKGRLGNQLFQYAFAKALSIKLNDPDIGIDWKSVHERHIEDNDGWEDSIKDFNVKYTNELQKLNRFQIVLFNLAELIERIQNKISQFTKKPYEIPSAFAVFLSRFGIFYYRNGFVKFSYPKHIKTKIIYGYFESPKYFENIDLIIKKEITPRYQPISENMDLYKIIKNNETICVSIRRGDFYSKDNASIYGVCSDKYYTDAVELIKKKSPNSVIVIFSDDIQWAKENLHFDGRVYFESGKDPLWEKLRLMYSCKHFVISNSTFSWWAQHLGRDSGKIVVAPSVWRNDRKKNDIWENNWTYLQ